MYKLFLGMEMCKKIWNKMLRKINKRLILRFTIMLLFCLTMIASAVLGVVYDNQIAYIAGIILLTAILTRFVDNYFVTKKEQSEQIGTLRKRIKILLFAWKDEHGSLGTIVTKISNYLMDNILYAEESFSKAVYKELKELYALTNSIDIPPNLTSINYKTDLHSKVRRYKIKDMDKIIELCENLKNID